MPNSFGVRGLALKDNAQIQALRVDTSGLTDQNQPARNCFLPNYKHENPYWQ